MSIFKKFKITNKGLYWGLIITFALLYLFVGFVSTLHSITFFHLANTMSLAILLGITYEIGQASVLFSILMTKNKDKFLPWALMFLLTALQVTANVYASFKFMSNSGSDDWVYWQKSILIGLQAQNAEMYQIIISWIAGALLPIVALGMTALVAQNMKLMTEEFEEKKKIGTVSDEEVEEIIENEIEKRTSPKENNINGEEISEEYGDLLIEKNDEKDNEEIDIHMGKTEDDIYEIKKEESKSIDNLNEDKDQKNWFHLDEDLESELNEIYDGEEDLLEDLDSELESIPSKKEDEIKIPDSKKV